MTDEQSKNRQDLPNETEGAAARGRDDCDAIIERLERAVAEERQHAAVLRKTAEELRFKLEILEKSYAKQLQDARLRGEAAECELADQRARMAALETAHEDAVRLLAEARTELARLRADRGPLPEAFSSTRAMRINAYAQGDSESLAEEGSQTINKLMTDSSWADEQQPVDRDKKRPEVPARADPNLPGEELVAPELLFTAKRDDKP